MSNPNTAVEEVSNEIIEQVDALNAESWKIHVEDPGQGLKLATKARTLSEKYQYKKGVAYSLRNMGVSNRYLSNLEIALSLSFQAMDMFAEMDDVTGSAQGLVSIGAIYYYMGDYEKSLDFFTRGIEENEKLGNEQTAAYAYNGAGFIYGTLGEKKKGLDYLLKALKICKEKGESPDLLASILDSVADVYLKDGQVEKALESYLECLEVSEKSDIRRYKGYALFGIGSLYQKEGKLKDAESYFLKSLEIFREIKYRVGEASSLLDLGKLLMLNKDFDRAEEHLKNSLKVAEKIKAKAVISETHEALANLYENKNDISLFVKHFKLFHQYNSEIYKDQQENKQKYLNIQHEMEKLQREAEINRLTNVVMKEKNVELERKTVELEKSYDNVSVLSKIGRDITSTLDLDTILNTVYENVNELMEATIFGIGIYKHDTQTIDFRLAIERGKRYEPYERTLNDKTQLAVWCLDNNKEVFINDFETESTRYIPDLKKANLSGIDLEDGTAPLEPKSLIYLPLQVKDKLIGLISVQSYDKDAYTKNHLNILKTLASYTSAALFNAHSYEKMQNTLKELKLTQQQLIQSEKMASLGELTAGIAHEIQNPLNFVNNFSEINGELIEEMLEFIESGEMDEVKALAKDISENELKINHHGKRADGIVKGMLQHSRGSGKNKEPVDLNALADEYLRLAYHGLRAKDKSFNATMRTDFDTEIKKVNMIPQDVGRVVLNLITNAFYVVSERKKLNQEGYEPTVTVRTNRHGKMVHVEIEDNGNGIPEKVLDKIFQPFFTTKPTGEGTGLGLSLSYDIIAAHGGEIKVVTKANNGTTFTVILPNE